MLNEGGARLDPERPILDAIRRVLEAWFEESPHEKFPADKIWPKLPKEIQKQLTTKRNKLPRKLVKLGLLDFTGGQIKASSSDRKGSPTTEYAFGPEITGRSTVDSWLYLEDPPHSGVRDLEKPLQRLIYGCPGSGKSYRLAQDASRAHRVIRTVFHPETRFADFVGSMRPLSVYKAFAAGGNVSYLHAPFAVPGEPTVLYVVQPGPLLKAYHLACEYPDESVVLIVEEMSRAVASQVFGDVFQLLDRLEIDDADGTPAGFSKYEIEPRADISAWLWDHAIRHRHTRRGRMRLPNNFYIWATVNRSDQNAKQMDSAFLRRWHKEYISYDAPCVYGAAEVPYGSGTVKWDDLRATINSRLKDFVNVPEDKFVGPYLLSERDLAKPDVIASDLWGYLWNDVLKNNASQFFEGCRTLEDVFKKWDRGNGEPMGHMP